MRLLKTDIDFERRQALELIEVWGDKIPAYAILSHTWSETPSEEVLYTDVLNGTARSKAQFSKVRGALEQAKRDSYQYMWIDTCCIDKTSSAELSEAINSMYQWYQNSQVCYAYLSDVSSKNFQVDFSQSRWFTRGWTLQELLAPKRVRFITQDWKPVGTRNLLHQAICEITSIDSCYLKGESIETASISKRMSWASCRNLTREEDVAYCLIGLFDVNMPMLYGEGQIKAFRRLQEEIIRTSEDHSIYCWWTSQVDESVCHSILADSPRYFRSGADIKPLARSMQFDPALITPRGIHIQLPVFSRATRLVAVLNCESTTPACKGQSLGISIRAINELQAVYARVECSGVFFVKDVPTSQMIYLQHRLLKPRKLPNVKRFIINLQKYYDVRDSENIRVESAECSHQRTLFPWEGMIDDDCILLDIERSKWHSHVMAVRYLISSDSIREPFTLVLGATPLLGLGFAIVLDEHVSPGVPLMEPNGQSVQVKRFTITVRYDDKHEGDVVNLQVHLSVVQLGPSYERQILGYTSQWYNSDQAMTATDTRGIIVSR